MSQGKLAKKGCAVDASIISLVSHSTKQMDIDVVAEDRQEDDTQPPAVTVSHSEWIWTRPG